MRPSCRDFYIDDETEYLVEVIDTWNILIRKAGIHKGHFRIQLPARPYIAVRLRRPSEEDYLEPLEDESVLDIVKETEPETVAEEVVETVAEAAEEVSTEAEGQLNLFEDIEELTVDEDDFEFTAEEPAVTAAPLPEDSMSLNMDEIDLSLPAEENDTEILDDIPSSPLTKTAEMSLTNSDLYKEGLDDIEVDDDLAEDAALDDLSLELEDDLPDDVIDEVTDSVAAEDFGKYDLLDDTVETDDLPLIDETLDIASMDFRK